MLGAWKRGQGVQGEDSQGPGNQHISTLQRGFRLCLLLLSSAIGLGHVGRDSTLCRRRFTCLRQVINSEDNPIPWEKFPVADQHRQKTHGLSSFALSSFFPVVLATLFQVCPGGLPLPPPQPALTCLVLPPHSPSTTARTEAGIQVWRLCPMLSKVITSTRGLGPRGATK